jgi:hypothetical protein
LTAANSSSDPKNNFDWSVSTNFDCKWDKNLW